MPLRKGFWLFAAFLGLPVVARAAILAPGPKAGEAVLHLEGKETARFMVLQDPVRLVVDISGATIPVQVHPLSQEKLEARDVRQGEGETGRRLVMEWSEATSPSWEEIRPGKLFLLRSGLRTAQETEQEPEPVLATQPITGGKVSVVVTPRAWEIHIAGAGSTQATVRDGFGPDRLIVDLPGLKLKPGTLKASNPLGNIEIQRAGKGSKVIVGLHSWLDASWQSAGREGKLILRRPAFWGKLITLDAGHGGHDPGALALNGVDKEKTMTLNVVLHLKDLLERGGARVQMIRSDDTFVSLPDRATLSNEAKADLFISIHANSLPWKPEANGTETYYFNEGGKLLAQAVHRQIIPATHQTDRGVRSARFFVIRKTLMPSILIETGFVTNDGDLNRLKNPTHVYNFAAAVVNGVDSYYGGKPFVRLIGGTIAPPVVVQPRPLISVALPITPKDTLNAVKLAESKVRAGGSRLPDMAWEAF